MEFVCRVKEANPDYRSACKNLPEYQGTGYCVLHYSSEDKKEDFKSALENKLAQHDVDFGGTVFPEGTSDFEGREFHADANFSGATFRGNVDFSKATFHREALFHRAIFKHTASFTGTTFEGSALFWEARFDEDANFFQAKFLKRTGFSAHENYKAFNLDREVLFDYIEIAKPELFAFRSIQLRPSWFIYVESTQELTFHEVSWYGLREGPKPRKEKEQDEAGGLGEDEAFRSEVNALESREEKGFRHSQKQDIREPYRLLASTYRRLSRNYEDNRKYPIANEFHYWSMDAARKRDWKFFKDKMWRDLLERKRWSDILRHFGLITTLYWALSGYGVRAARAFWMLVAIWAAFTTLYVLVDPSEFKNFGQGIGYRWQAAVYSLLALVRLNPEPRPDEPGVFQFLVGLEGILGPLQIALLALAIRRKVMR